MFLIVTNQRDITADYIVLELQRRRHVVFRLNVEELRDGCVDFDPFSDEQFFIKIHKKEFNLKQIKAAYFRRPGALEAHNDIVSMEMKDYVVAEWATFLRSMYITIGSRWLNSPDAISIAENKPLQLYAARILGFHVPPTVITNMRHSANTLIARGSAVAKPLRHNLVHVNQQERAIFTNKIDGLYNVPDDSVKYAPIIFQKEIKKKFDIRVTVVENNVFACAIHSQDKAETKTDWRRGSYPDLKHEAIDLPSDIVEKCRKLLQYFSIKFGAIDLILDKCGAYWFLEINPNGQWAWIENRTGLPITKSLVDSLEAIEKRH